MSFAEIAIVGAGWLGGAVAERLIAAGASVIATTRGAERPARLPAAARHHRLDLLAGEAAPGPLAPAEAWIVAIAPGRDQDRDRVYLGGADAIARWLPASCRRLIWIGSTSALPSKDACLDEDEPGWPSEPRGRIQREAERRIAEAATRAGVPWFVLRMGGLYGPGRELARIFADGDRVLPGDGMAATNLVHRDDASSAVVAALAAPPDRSGIVHVVDDDHCSRREMYAAVASARGLAAPRWADPPGPRVVGKRVANARLRAWLGVELEHPHHGAGPERVSTPGTAPLRDPSEGLDL